jgi:hypothetical protein
MAELDKIEVELKTGDEQFILNKQPLDISLLNFWRWSVSDLVSNATRGRLAEFIVANALEIDLKAAVRDEWAAFDLETREGIKVEVKSAAYLQSWSQSKLSNICFSIKPSRYWNSSTNVFSETPVRQANVYVFCLLRHEDKTTVDPMNFDQWEFYVVPAEKLNSYPRSQTSITIRSLQSLAPPPVSYNMLKKTIFRGFQFGCVRGLVYALQINI